MNLIILGATGLVGAGALREALADRDVASVLVVGRHSCGVTDAKLREVVVGDLFAIDAIERDLTGLDACIWAIGVSSIGRDESEYARVTEELTLLWARALLRLNPSFSFCYCSAAGADGKGMWQRVRRRVEAALRAMPFRHSGCVRPALIKPGPGLHSRTLAYRLGNILVVPFFPLLVRLAPSAATTSGRLGRAMLRVVQGRAGKYILESADINRIGA